MTVLQRTTAEAILGNTRVLGRSVFVTPDDWNVARVSTRQPGLGPPGNPIGYSDPKVGLAIAIGMTIWDSHRGMWLC